MIAAQRSCRDLAGKGYDPSIYENQSCQLKTDRAHDISELINGDAGTGRGTCA